MYLLAMLLCCACGAAEPQRPNLLLISIDTLRADHLGVYGYERDTSPNLDAFAARSVRYAEAVAPAPWTLPSHVAMLSGRHPFDAGIEKLQSGRFHPIGFADLVVRLTRD